MIRDPKIEELKIISVILSEMKSPKRFFIPKHHIIYLTKLLKHDFYPAFARLMSQTYSLETKPGYVVVQTEPFKEFIKEYHPDLLEVLNGT